MELIKGLIDFVLHIDKHLVEITGEYQGWTYLILFAIIFCETGLVVTPILPGDSLLFAVGALAVRPDSVLNVFLLFVLLSVAAILGDTVNYMIGRYLGTKIVNSNSRLIKKEHIDRTHEFYEKYGGKTIILARFVPIVRTFAPFVAGAGAMNYSKFIFFNVVGGLLWIGLGLGAGVAFGGIPVVQENFSLVVLGIVFVSLLPMVFEYVRSRREKKSSVKEEPAA